jgi:aryl-alcohol dehydrogenase-like predicted oxidoreductase
VQTQSPIKTRALGNSDLHITPVGFGAWAVGGGEWQFGWGDQDDRESIAAIHRALELGINWIDTAAVYGLGHSEEVVARALSEWSGPRPYVFTKCGMVWGEDRKVDYCLRAESVRRECENSLRRLRVDAIDLYQVHWPADDAAETAEGWIELAKLQREGKIRWIGASNFNLEELQAVQRIAPVTSLQPPYSLIRREAEIELLPYCQSQRIGVICYSPMASGLLSGAMTRERIASLPINDWRSRNPEFQEPRLSRNLLIAQALRNIGQRHGYTAGEVAIAWVLRHPAITGAIVGARNARQVEEIVRAMNFTLAPIEIEELHAV